MKGYSSSGISTAVFQVAEQLCACIGPRQDLAWIHLNQVKWRRRNKALYRPGQVKLQPE
jgi:hypothetical protein